MLRFVFEVVLPPILIVIGGLLIADEIWLAVLAGFCAGGWVGSQLFAKAYHDAKRSAYTIHESKLDLLTENKRLESEVLRLKAEVDETTNLS